MRGQDWIGPTFSFPRSAQRYQEWARLLQPVSTVTRPRLLFPSRLEKHKEEVENEEEEEEEENRTSGCKMRMHSLLTMHSELNKLISPSVITNSLAFHCLWLYLLYNTVM